MATTETNYTADGTQTVFSIGFDYIKAADVKVSFNGTVTTAYTLNTSTNTIQTTSTQVAGTAIRIYRETSDAALSSTFYPGSSIKATSLNDNFKQSLYIAQETSNRTTSAATVANAALPKAGGTMTGNLVFAAGQTTATTSAPNIVQLNNSTSSTSQTQAATANAVKLTYDLAATKGRINSASAFTTSGSAVTVTLPLNPKRVTISLYDVTCTVSAILSLRINGLSSGYVSSCILMSSSGNTSLESTTTFVLGGGHGALAEYSGNITLVQNFAEHCTSSHVIGTIHPTLGTARQMVGSGYAQVGGPWSTIQLICSAGTFNGGLLTVVCDSTS